MRRCFYVGSLTLLLLGAPISGQQLLTSLGTPLLPFGNNLVEEMAFDPTNRSLYLLNRNRHVVVQISEVSAVPLTPRNAAPWAYTTVAGQDNVITTASRTEVTATAATFNAPTGIVGWPRYAVGPTTTLASPGAPLWVGLWIADCNNNALRFINFDRSRNVTLVAGSPYGTGGTQNGIGVAASVLNPSNIVWGRFLRSAAVGANASLSRSSNAAVRTSVLYWSDWGSHCLRQGVPLHNDSAYSPLRNVPSAVATDLSDMVLNVSSFAGVCGTSGSGVGAVMPWSPMFFNPIGVVLVGLPTAPSSTAVLFIGDANNHRVSMIAPIYPISARIVTSVYNDITFAVGGVTIGRVLPGRISSPYSDVRVEVLVGAFDSKQFLNVSIAVWVNTSNTSVGVTQGPTVNVLATTGINVALNAVTVRYTPNSSYSGTLVVFSGNGGTVLEFYCCLGVDYSQELLLEDTTGLFQRTGSWSESRTWSESGTPSGSRTWTSSISSSLSVRSGTKSTTATVRKRASATMTDTTAGISLSITKHSDATRSLLATASSTISAWRQSPSTTITSSLSLAQAGICLPESASCVQSSKCTCSYCPLRSPYRAGYLFEPTWIGSCCRSTDARGVATFQQQPNAIGSAKQLESSVQLCRTVALKCLDGAVNEQGTNDLRLQNISSVSVVAACFEPYMNCLLRVLDATDFSAVVSGGGRCPWVREWVGVLSLKDSNDMFAFERAVNASCNDFTRSHLNASATTTYAFCSAVARSAMAVETKILGMKTGTDGAVDESGLVKRGISGVDALVLQGTAYCQSCVQPTPAGRCDCAGSTNPTSISLLHSQYSYAVPGQGCYGRPMQLSLCSSMPHVALSARPWVAETTLVGRAARALEAVPASKEPPCPSPMVQSWFGAHSNQSADGKQSAIVNVSLCLPADTVAYIMTSESRCFSPGARTAANESGMVCGCPSTSVMSVPMEWFNESSNAVQPGTLQLCGKQQGTTVPAAVTLTASLIASVVGGAAMSGLQTAMLLGNEPCSSKTRDDFNPSSSTPYVIGTSRARGWYGLMSFIGALLLAHALLVLLIYSVIRWRNEPRSESVVLSQEDNACDANRPQTGRAATTADDAGGDNPLDAHMSNAVLLEDNDEERVEVIDVMDSPRGNVPATSLSSLTHGTPPLTTSPAMNHDTHHQHQQHHHHKNATVPSGGNNNIHESDVRTSEMPTVDGSPLASSSHAAAANLRAGSAAKRQDNGTVPRTNVKPNNSVDPASVEEIGIMPPTKGHQDSASVSTPVKVDVNSEFASDDDIIREKNESESPRITVFLTHHHHDQGDKEHRQHHDRASPILLPSGDSNNSPVNEEVPNRDATATIEEAARLQLILAAEKQPDDDVEFDRLAQAFPYALTVVGAACAKGRFPDLSVKVLLFGFQGLAFQTIKLLAFTEGPGDYVAGVFGALVLLVTVIIVCGVARVGYIQAQRGEMVFLPYEAAHFHFHRWLVRVLLPSGFWVANYAYRYNLMALLTSFAVERASWAPLLHFIKSLAIAFIVVLRPSQPVTCSIIYLVLSIFFAVLMVTFLVFRPHRFPTDNYFAALVSFLTGLLVICLAVDGTGMVADDLLNVILYVSITGMVISFGVTVAEHTRWIKIEKRYYRLKHNARMDSGHNKTTDV